MISIPFDVNNNKLRENFFDHLLTDCIDSLSEDALPLWGKMTPQNMVEHLIWAFERSTGKVELPCLSPENILERTRTFLYENRPMPQEYKHPLLGEDPEPLRYTSFTESKNALHVELINFLNHFREEPTAVHVHAVLGPLNAEDWQRCHFKHCYHHLMQFGLIRNDESSKM